MVWGNQHEMSHLSSEDMGGWIQSNKMWGDPMYIHVLTIFLQAVQLQHLSCLTAQNGQVNNARISNRSWRKPAHEQEMRRNILVGCPSRLLMSFFPAKVYDNYDNSLIHSEMFAGRVIRFGDFSRHAGLIKSDDWSNDSRSILDANCRIWAILGEPFSPSLRTAHAMPPICVWSRDATWQILAVVRWIMNACCCCLRLDSWQQNDCVRAVAGANVYYLLPQFDLSRWPMSK